MTVFLKTSLALLLLAALSSCNSADQKAGKISSDSTEVAGLSMLKQTDFVPTLENPISGSRNSIYSPTFLYAWNKIEQQLESEVIAGISNSSDFKLLTESQSHQNSLTDKEYTVTIEKVDDAIIARAYFSKTLPFETKLEVLEKPILFGNTNVSAFGMYYYNEDVVKFTEIMYYKDDDHFILKLTPKDRLQEIILAKGLDSCKTLAEALKKNNGLIEIGKNEKKDVKQSWKFEWVRGDDMFAIPAVKFNIDTRYKNLEGQRFITNDKKEHLLQEAYQRTGFILNENGATVESEAEAVTDSMPMKPEIRHPKKMIFDRPFLIILKRTDKSNPYFVMAANNAELFIKK
jgi:hypothetical protein